MSKESAWHHAERENFTEALDVLSQIEARRPLRPDELVLRSRCLQLSDTGSLSQAEGALRQALELDPKYVPALIDLGWFYYAVNDDPKNAEPFFESAIEISKTQFLESIEGKVECLGELSSEKVAKNFARALQRSIVSKIG